MLKKVLVLILSIFPIFSLAKLPSEESRVYIEKDGKLYLVTDGAHISEIIESAEIIEIDPNELEEIEMAGTLTESQEKPVER